MSNIKMQMTNDEIVRSYKEAKHKGHQIEVLSDLNLCPKEMIIDILVEGGIDPRAFARYKGANNLKRVKKEVKTHEKKKRNEADKAIVNEALTLFKDKLSAEYEELKAEWERISAEYEYKLLAIERVLGVGGGAEI
jgi:hypothetical protein